MKEDEIIVNYFVFGFDSIEKKVHTDVKNAFMRNENYNKTPRDKAPERYPHVWFYGGTETVRENEYDKAGASPQPCAAYRHGIDCSVFPKKYNYYCGVQCVLPRHIVELLEKKEVPEKPLDSVKRNCYI